MALFSFIMVGKIGRERSEQKSIIILCDRKYHLKIQNNPRPYTHADDSVMKPSLRGHVLDD